MKIQHGTNIKFSYPKCTFGKSGYGFYGYKSNLSSMRNYYDSGHIVEFIVDDSLILDLTVYPYFNHCKAWLSNRLNKKVTKNIFQQSGILIQEFIKTFYSDKKACINFHFGSNIPSSKEIVIFDTSIISEFKWIK